MRARLLLSVLGCVATAIGALTGCATAPARQASEQPIPTFPAPPPPGLAGQVGHHRDTLLPTDCADVLPGANMSALLGQPTDSVGVHTVRGVGSPSVGRLERVACQYQRAGVKGASALELNLAAYATPTAADGQTSTNSAGERADAQTVEPISIGSARGTLFVERGKSVLLVSSGRSTVSMTLRDGVVPPGQARPVMLDLAQRVLPNLAPEPPRASR